MRDACDHVPPLSGHLRDSPDRASGRISTFGEGAILAGWSCSPALPDRAVHGPESFRGGCSFGAHRCHARRRARHVVALPLDRCGLHTVSRLSRGPASCRCHARRRAGRKFRAIARRLARQAVPVGEGDSSVVPDRADQSGERVLLDEPCLRPPYTSGAGRRAIGGIHRTERR